jgi:hypothetical protein
LKRNQSTRELDQCKVVGAASLPAYEQATEAVVPRVGAFDDPAPRLTAYFADEWLLAAPSDVRSDPSKANRRCDVRIVVALVETQVLGTPRTSRTSYDHRVEYVANHRRVWHIRSADQHCERDTATICQYMTFYAAFRAVRRVRPREVPPFGAFTEALSRELHFHAIPRRPS